MKSRLTALLIALLAAATTPGLAIDPPRVKVILDTDIGTDIDDAWTLAYVVRSPRFEVLGVTITDGDTTARGKLACKLLHRLGRTDIPVAVGAPTPPVPAERIDYQFGWAEDFTAYRPVAARAADFILDAVRRHSGAITILGVGPLQNLGEVVARDPELATRVHRVVLMSGSIERSAWDPWPTPEWNVKVSVRDSQRVYSAGLPLTIVPLDSTTYVRLEDRERFELRGRPTPIVTALEALYRLWMDEPSSRMTLHDQLAAAEAEQPGRFFRRCEPLPLRVDAEGYTRVDSVSGKRVNVCLEPKRDEFMRHFLATVAAAPTPNP